LGVPSLETGGGWSNEDAGAMTHILDNDVVEKVLTMDDCLEAVEQAFTDRQGDRGQPRRRGWAGRFPPTGSWRRYTRK